MNTQLYVAELNQIERAAFYRKTYLHVAGALLAFILLESVLLSIDSLVQTMFSFSQGLWLLLIGLFWIASIISNKFAYSVSKPKQYLGLGLYVVIEALIFIPILHIASVYHEGVIQQAATVSLFLFIGLTAVAFMSKQDFSFLSTVITIGSFIGLGALVCGMIFGFQLGLWFSVFMVLLAGAGILYQTSLIKYQYTEDQYVGAALGLFSSLMLMFWYILRIFMSRD